MRIKEHVSANYKILVVTTEGGPMTPDQMLALLEQQRDIQQDYDLAGVDVPGQPQIYLVYRKRIL